MQYCICTECETSYDMDQCIVQKTCTHVRFPNHPQKSRRNACQAELLKKVKTGITYTVCPKKVYIYHSVIENVKLLLSRPNFVQLCGKWKEQNERSDIFSDIYDGVMWERFRYHNGMCFLHNLGFMLSVDWLQLYEHLQYSVGVIYLSVLNLPCSERYKVENIIVVGCIPGPNEPQNMNAYLKPMVDELLLLWDGILSQPYSYAVPVLIRCCLVGIASDVPATQMVCSFTSCTSTQGCSKCMKSFPCASFSEKLDFSGFDRSSWLKGL